MNEGRSTAIRQALDDNDLFGALDDDDINQLVAYGTTSRYRSGKTIFQRGDPGDSMMVVLSGRVKICNFSIEGRETVLNFIEPGQVFGEIAILDGLERTADAVTIAPSELFILRRRELIPFLETHPTCLIRLVEGLCGKLRNTTNMVENIMFHGMTGRFARGLLRLAEEYGRRKDGVIHLDVKLSQRDIGGYVGLARENINRQLRHLRERGLVRVDDGHIVILDERGLYAISESGETL